MRHEARFVENECHKNGDNYHLDAEHRCGDRDIAAFDCKEAENLPGEKQQRHDRRLPPKCDRGKLAAEKPEDIERSTADQVGDKRRTPQPHAIAARLLEK